MDTKVVINLKEEYVELTGSEEFVAKHLQEFKTLLLDNRRPVTHAGNPSHGQPKEGGIPEVKKENGGKAKPGKSKTIQVERFDLHKDDNNPSLEDFLAMKKPPPTAAMHSLVIGYYITHIKGGDSFSEGQIDYAYKTLGLKGRPNHLRQTLINIKNEKDFVEGTDDGRWRITRTGEIFVEEKLPPSAKS